MIFAFYGRKIWKFKNFVVDLQQIYWDMRLFVV